MSIALKLFMLEPVESLNVCNVCEEARQLICFETLVRGKSLSTIHFPHQRHPSRKKVFIHTVMFEILNPTCPSRRRGKRSAAFICIRSSSVWPLSIVCSVQVAHLGLQKQMTQLPRLCSSYEAEGTLEGTLRPSVHHHSEPGGGVAILKGACIVCDWVDGIGQPNVIFWSP